VETIDMRMPPTLARFAAVLTLAAAALAAQSTPPTPETETLLEQWFSMSLGGSPSGMVHSVIRRIDEDGTTRIETDVETRMTVRRLGATLEIEQHSLFVEDAEGRPIRARARTRQSGQESEVEITFFEDEIELVTTLMGRSRERYIDRPEGLLGPWALSRIGVGRGWKTGDEWTAKTFSAEAQIVTELRTIVLGPESIELPDGRVLDVIKTEDTMAALGVKTTNWVDREGAAVRTRLSMTGVPMELLLCDEATARAAAQGSEAPPPDMLTASMVVAHEFVPYPRAADGAVLTVRTLEAGDDLPLADGAGQRVGARAEDGSRVVTIRREVPPANRSPDGPSQEQIDAELAAALADNTMIQCDEPEIRKIASQVAGDEQDPWRTAQVFERWVFDNITEKNFDVGFASALEVCRDRSGDCSEHAVLLAALCRARGIPCRVVMGVLYVGGIWAGHAWNEVFVDGRWYALDGTQGYGSADPLRLAVVSMTMADDAGMGEFVGLIGTLGNIAITVDSVEYRGETLSLDEGITIDAGRYVNRLWGFACTAPDGFVLERGRPSRGISFEILEIEGADAAGRDREFEIDALDTPSDFDWNSASKMLGDAQAVGGERSVDGRTARRFLVGDSCYTVVHVGDALFLIELEDYDADTDEDLLTSFLDTVDFDV
jgi:hypothetical protein